MSDLTHEQKVKASKFSQKNQLLINNVIKHVNNAPDGFDWNDVQLPNDVIMKLTGNLDSTQSSGVELSHLSLIDLINTVKALPFEQSKQFTVSVSKSDDENDLVRFVEYHMSYDELKSVRVDESINGREQQFLNLDSVDDIGRIDLEQYQPCYASVIDGEVQWLDGSRRKAKAESLECGLLVRVSIDELSKAEAKYIASKIQNSHKPHSIRERGKAFHNLLESGLSKEEIANSHNISIRTVNRYLNASSVSLDLLTYIADINLVTLNQWVSLYKLEFDLLPKKRLSVKEHVASVIQKDAFKDVLGDIELSVEERQEKLIDFLVKLTPKKATPKKEKIKEYSDKTWIRPSHSKYAFSVDFGRLKSEHRDELLKAIQSKMDDFFE